jgi:predicted TIM-barrel fold metal-dependent hydrolase
MSPRFHWVVYYISLGLTDGAKVKSSSVDRLRQEKENLVLVDTHVHVGLRNYVSVEELDNSYISACVKQYPSRLAAVCIVDHRSEDAPETLEYWVSEHGVQGIRLDGTDTSPNEKLAVWEKAADLGINVSVSGNISTLSEIARKLTDLNLLVEHTGMPKTNGDTIVKLAEYDNVFVKFTTGGLHGVSSKPYPYKDAQPFFKRIHEVFRPDRIMWGSDYPPVEGREGYARSLDFIKKEVDWLSDGDREWILGGTAMKVWRFR